MAIKQITDPAIKALAKELKPLIKFGNDKLPTTTAIFNLSPAHSCPSDALGLCKNSAICYAKRPEKRFPEVVPAYRQRQQDLWLNNTPRDLARAFWLVLSAKRKKPLFLRFNESGDFHNNDCIYKMNFIAGYLGNAFAVQFEHEFKAYCYTARKDLSFSRINTRFLHVMASNFTLHNMGEFRTVKVPSGSNPVCPGDCKVCSLCASHKGTIEVVEH